MLYQQDLPLYLQIKNAIVERIISGLYRDRLPGEHALTNEFDVARGTIKQAIDTLVREGLLIKQQGKGTFIDQKTVTALHREYPVVAISTPRPDSIETQLITMIDTMADAKTAQTMGMTVGVPIIRLERRHFVADKSPNCKKIVGYTITYLNGTLYAGLSGLRGEIGLYEQLRTLFGNSPNKMIEKITAVAADKTVAKWLEIDENSAVMHICRTGFDRDNHIAERSHSYLLQSEISLQFTTGQVNREDAWWGTLK